jgi:hypothetical protein
MTLVDEFWKSELPRKFIMKDGRILIGRNTANVTDMGLIGIEHEGKVVLFSIDMLAYIEGLDNER